MTTRREPNAAAPAVRRFRDPAYVPQAETLGELREGIDAVDAQIVALIVQRARLVKDATRFKRDAFQVAAPARQAEVFQRVRGLAAEHGPEFADLPEMVEAAYRTLVGGFIAGEQRLFDETEPIEAKP